METIWFALAALILAIYVVMDGFDFGAGALHLWLARDDKERRQVLAAIGPFWDGNEVWLLAGGGVLFLAFPKVLASGLSGFYLAIMLLLWALILRGIAIEFRSHVFDLMWRSLWDLVFCLASALSPLLLGAALGNLIRGVPLRSDGWFSLSLFDSFTPRGALGILDWYTLLVGLFALTAIAHHGALFLAWKTDGPLRLRSLLAAGRLFPLLVVLWVAAAATSASLAPQLITAILERPTVWAATALLLIGLTVSVVARRAGRDLLAFLGSGAFLLGLLGATAASLFPVLIRSSTAPDLSLTAFNSASSQGSLHAGLLWLPPGLVLAIVYSIVLFRLHRGKAQSAVGEGY